MKLSLACAGLLLSWSFSLSAAVITVSNDPAKPAQYTSPATALAAAANGDTLYIYGSPNDYGSLTINKNITLIGAGNNTRKDLWYKTLFSSITLSGSVLNGVTIDGIYCQLFIISPPAGVVQYSNITLRNSIVQGNLLGNQFSNFACGSVITNWLFENSYIETFTMPLNTACSPIAPVTNGFVLRNSIVNSFGGGYNMVAVNSQIGSTGGTFQGMRDNTFNNCIFYSMFFTQTASNFNNQFNSCLTYLTQQPNAGFDLQSWSGGASGSANNCIINQNPLWLTTPSSSLFSTIQSNTRNGWNPAIQVSSPARNAGTDGTDIGLTGGLVPYSFQAEPAIPVIRRYQLINAVVPPSGTVTIQATSTKAQ